MRAFAAFGASVPVLRAERKVGVEGLPSSSLVRKKNDKALRHKGYTSPQGQAILKVSKIRAPVLKAPELKAPIPNSRLRNSRLQNCSEIQGSEIRAPKFKAPKFKQNREPKFRTPRCRAPEVQAPKLLQNCKLPKIETQLKITSCFLAELKTCFTTLEARHPRDVIPKQIYNIMGVLGVADGLAGCDGGLVAKGL